MSTEERKTMLAARISVLNIEVGLSENELIEAVSNDMLEVQQEFSATESIGFIQVHILLPSELIQRLGREKIAHTLRELRAKYEDISNVVLVEVKAPVSPEQIMDYGRTAQLKLNRLIQAKIAIAGGKSKSLPARVTCTDKTVH